jgi:hypothetical protein
VFAERGFVVQGLGYEEFEWTPPAERVSGSDVESEGHGIEVAL